MVFEKIMPQKTGTHASRLLIAQAIKQSPAKFNLTSIRHVSNALRLGEAKQARKVVRSSQKLNVFLRLLFFKHN
jgi:hypothetical protein